MSGRHILPALTCAALLVGCVLRSRSIQPVELPASEAMPSAAPRATRLSIDLVTYNVAGLPRFVVSHDPRETHPKMGAPLGAFDLVLLQEDFWYHDLIEAPHRWRVRPRRGFLLQLGDGLARFSRFPLSAVEHVPWSTAHGIIGHYNDRLAAKGFAAGTVEVAPGALLWVYNVHFDAGGDPGDRRARERQRAQLRAHIAKNVPPEAALLVAGDFNCGPSRLRELCEDAALIDAGVGGIDRVLFRSGQRIELTPAELDAAAALDALGGLSDHSPLPLRLEIEVKDDVGSAAAPSGHDRDPEAR